MAPAEIPVVVVGSGAAGTMLALRWRAGIDARVVDRLPSPSAYSRAVTVHARMLEIFEQIDPDSFSHLLASRASRAPVTSCITVARGQRHAVRPGLDYRRCRRATIPAREQPARNRGILRDYLRAHFDRAPEWGVTCTVGSGAAGGHALAMLEHADGRRGAVSCRYLVACDGAELAAPRPLGLTQDGERLRRRRSCRTSTSSSDFPDDPAWMHYCMGPGALRDGR